MKLIKLVFTITILMFAVSSWACTCTMTPIESHIKETKNIVIIEVVELLDTPEERIDYYFSKPDQSYRVKVRIITSYKGKLKTGELIDLDSEFSNCDIYFKDKQKYLLFLDKKKYKYSVRHCSYSESIENGDKNIVAIETVLKKDKK
ncbi:hypothetical protein [Adhaeribacter soli]|uniref:Uncharacterized protein n=1 Tax=Adhaeribacter soli TaxID=2607655 RepID=A0A5N1J1Y0_9BACT|nr:hypothetical protein [Adhaeribacter soli]KAA9340589.1 hypothetical protein F0P94_03940 [Adhaeribacter soli]